MQPIRNVFLGIDCFQSNVFFGSVCQVSDLVTVGLPPLNWSNYPPDDGGAGRGFIATTAYLAPPLSTRENTNIPPAGFSTGCRGPTVKY